MKTAPRGQYQVHSVYKKDGEAYRDCMTCGVPFAVNWKKPAEECSSCRDSAKGVVPLKAPRKSRAKSLTPKGRLSDDEVREIRRRRAEGESERSVAERFGLSRSYVGDIAKRRSRKDVE